MKTLILIAMMVVPATAFAVEDSDRFEAYKQRRAARRASALYARRQYNATKGPHVYRTAIAMTAPIMPLGPVEHGFIQQPAIPVRPVLGVRYNDAFRYSLHPRYRAAIQGALKKN